MKQNIPSSFSRRPWLAILLCLGVCLSARAGLTLEMNLVRFHQSGYYFFPNLNTNSSGPAVPFGTYFVTSPSQPTNGASVLYQFTTNGFSQINASTWAYGDFNSMKHELTNGYWTLFVTNSVTTNAYYFTISGNFSSNALPLVSISSPADGAVNVTNRPTFTWQGPANYGGITFYLNSLSTNLPAAQTSLLSPTVLYQGLNNGNVHYDSNSTTVAISSVPTNSVGQPVATWVSTTHLQDYSTAQFTVGSVDMTGTSHTLVAHYTWDSTDTNGAPSGADSSGNQYDLDFADSFGSQGGLDSTTDHAAGPRAIQFHDGDSASAGYVGWNSTPTNLLSALAGSFSISCWIKTTQDNYGWDQAPAYYGAGIISADNNGLANDLIPLALTGGTIGFNTGGDTEDVTLNSVNTVNDGNYHHVVVTRNQSTGQKIVYLDGLMDNFSSGTTNLLDGPQLLTIGALSGADDPDASSTYYYNGYDGLLDDLQIYSGVLSSNEVAGLFANPGLTVDQLITVPLVARYNFENTNNAGLDSSGNGNDSNCGSGNGGTNLDTFSTDAAKGTFARQFFGDTSICFDPNFSLAFRSLSNALRESFSWTAWIKTTNSVNGDAANAYLGSPIWFEYADSVNQAILSVTGSKAAFTVGNPGGGSDTTLHSTTSVNDGNYHFIAATRNQASGVMHLYVDGNLEDTAASTNHPIVAASTIYLAGGYNANFQGLLDDVRTFAGELSAADVATLFGTPISDFNFALGTTNLTWTTSGDSHWFIQTTNTYNGSGSAAQSGSVTDFQSSTLQTTVVGPGTLTFYWSSFAEDPNFGFDYEFDIDGNYVNDIVGDTSWYQDGPYAIGPGSHTLSWTVFANGDSDPTQAGYLDQVEFTPANPLVITLQPIDQTNYPGYAVTLLADTTNNPAPAWQWYKLGSGLISSATNKFFVPTNSGNASVAGGYYAVATGLAGSVNTRTAIVTFASAAFPPDWAAAFRAQLYGDDNQEATTNYGIALLVDSSGNLYTANSFTGSNTFGSDHLISGPNRFSSGLLKHTASGNPIWGRGLTNSGNGNSFPQCLAPAPGDGVYMSGAFSGTNQLGTNVLQETAGGSTYLARFDAAGNILWVRTFAGTNQQIHTYHELVADPAGNVTISVLGNNFINLGTTNVLLDGQRPLLVQYDANGNVRWLQRPSGWVQYMAYDSGRIYLSFEGNTVAYIGGVTNVSDRRWALASLNATNGQAAWVRGIGSLTNEVNLNGISFDVPVIAVSGSNVFVAGTGWGSNATFGPFSVSWPNPNGQYFARYDTNGNAQLALPFGGTHVAPWAAKADASGNVYIGGDFDGYAAFGSKVIGGAHLDDIQNGLFYGQTFLAKFDRNGTNLWARRAQSPVSYANLRDIALATDGVWADGFVNQYASFGSYTVYGTVTCIGFPFCTLGYHVGGYLAKVSLNPIDPHPVSADLRVEVYRQQSLSFGDSFIVFPYFNSVSPAATGTTTNTIVSPNGKFHGEINSAGNFPGSFILFSLDQLINEFTNGQWTLFINKGMPSERQFHFTASVSALTTNLLSAVRIITPTNGATGVPTNSPFQWNGPATFSSLGVNKQKFDGTEQASASLPVTATNWPSPPTMTVGTNRFSITYTSNNFPNITFTVPVDNVSLAVSNWAPHFNLLSTAASVFVVGGGASAVQIVNVSQTGSSFQFQFVSQTGLTHEIQYRTNLAAGTWQTYTNIAGDGTLKTVTVPISGFAPEVYLRVATH